MQQPDTITRLEIFSLSQRLTHWVIAVGVMFELVSAWLIQHSDVDVEAWFDWHLMIGQVLMVALAYRVFLLFRPGSGHWRLLVPTREQRHIIVQTLKFYLSLGRLNCPDWYAFNPVWQPLYLLITLVIMLTTLSGMLIGSYLFPLGLTMPQLHSLLADVILFFVIAHIAFVFLHDSKGNGAHLSAMVNGYKYFQLKQSAHNSDPNSALAENSVSLDDLLKK